VQPDLFEGIFLKGVIQSVISSPEMRINNGNPEYSVKVALEDGSGKIKPGMTVSVNINLNRAEKKVSLK
jgi:multidrug efflux pump subunit AcrA (membrane-fusion protein)